MAVKNLGRVVGKSAYELWLEAGHTGTIDDFILALKGEAGDTGNGIASIAKTGTEGLIDTYTITFTDGTTTTFTVTNGSSGEASKTTIQCSGDSGSFTASQMLDLLAPMKNVVIVNDRDVYISVNKQPFYHTYLSITPVSDTALSFKAIYVNVNAVAVNYGTWSKEEVVPSQPVATTIKALTATTHRGQLVPEFTVEQILSAYNAFISGKDVVLVSSDDYQNFKVIEAHAIGQLIAVFVVYNKDMMLCYQVTDDDTVSISSTALFMSAFDVSSIDLASADGRAKLFRILSSARSVNMKSLILSNGTSLSEISQVSASVDNGRGVCQAHGYDVASGLIITYVLDFTAQGAVIDKNDAVVIKVDDSSIQTIHSPVNAIAKLTYYNDVEIQ